MIKKMGGRIIKYYQCMDLRKNANAKYEKQNMATPLLQIFAILKLTFL